MTDGKVYVVGAGLAGLSASVALSSAGAAVELVETSGQAGGRCRSYFDAALSQVIDNGNHFIVSGNRAAMAYLKTIGTHTALVGPDHARTSFMDMDTGERWTLAPNDGMLPWWLFDRSRRVPGTIARDYLDLVSLLAARPEQTIADVMPCSGPLWSRLLRPFFLGALNTQPEAASAALAGRLVRETFAKGGNAYRTRIAHPTLAAVFVEPALRLLSRAGATVKFGERLKKIGFAGTRVASLEFGSGSVDLYEDDRVILAVPPWVAADLVPGTPAPDRFSAIVNAHFKIPGPPDAPGMLGLLGATAEWVFSFPDRVSVTISGADRLVDIDREELAQTLWSDICSALGLPRELPPWQIVKEKRATFAATPEQNRKRPDATTRWKNLFLAGDWTNTGLPATIEGAVRSGRRAAELANGRRAV